MARSLIFLVLPILLHQGVWTTQNGKEITVPCPVRARYQEAARTGEPFRLPRGCMLQESVVAYNPAKWLELMAQTDQLIEHDKAVTEHYESCTRDMITCSKDLVDAADECVTLLESASTALKCPTPRPCPAWGDRALGAVTAGALCVGLQFVR
jgi:hypothetical protein